ncbi:hypothetical protein MTP99_002307 [Tenebrio molitor]|nr:hypothetical protein MTP99_002307 [Tenebrio molitor]
MKSKNDNARRERGKNYTEKEKEMALTVIDRYRCIVDNKAADGASQKERNCAWQKIVQEYNASAVSAPRTVKQLKILWSNLRRVAKKVAEYT